MNSDFMGTPEFAVPSMRRLIEAGHVVRAVLTQPDRPVGRRQTITPPPVKLFAAGHGIESFSPRSSRRRRRGGFSSRCWRRPTPGWSPPIGRILPAWMLDAPRHGCLNVHSSLLPKYRGAAPINWAVARGERETGVTIMHLPGLDTGPILLQRATPVGEHETAAELTPRLAELGAGLLVEALAGLERGEFRATPQDDAEHLTLRSCAAKTGGSTGG